MYIAIANHLLYGIIGETLSQITGIMRTVLQFIANLAYWDFGLMWIVKILKNLTFVSIKVGTAPIYLFIFLRNDQLFVYFILGNGCKTKSGPSSNQECIFPFIWYDKTYYGCPIDDDAPDERWC